MICGHPSGDVACAGSLRRRTEKIIVIFTPRTRKSVRVKWFSEPNSVSGRGRIQTLAYQVPKFELYQLCQLPTSTVPALQNLGPLVRLTSIWNYQTQIPIEKYTWRKAGLVNEIQYTIKTMFFLSKQLL